MSTNRYAHAGCWVLLALVAAAAPCGCKGKSMPLPGASRPRLVTYSPALTQMVVDLGLSSHLVGVTSHCTVPPDLHPVVVGDALQPSVEAILSARPDVVLAQIAPDQLRALHSVAPEVRVEHFAIERLADIPVAVERIGQIAGHPELAESRLAKWRATLEGVDALIAAAGRERPRVLFVMGYQQPSTGGAGTFLSDMIERAGGMNASSELKGWSPIGLEYAIGARPDVLVCLLDTASQSELDARRFWQPVASGSGRPARLVILTDRNWTIPGLHTADCVRKLAEIIHGPGEAGAGAGSSAATSSAPAISAPAGEAGPHASEGAAP
jgi:iron complex transport system substrate-binding protein